jgi:SAM-dependent methyltransferase
MKSGPSRVEDYFQRTAVDFDGLYEHKNLVQYWTNRLFRKALFERLRLTLEAFRGTRDFSALDVGCGSGRNSIFFAEAGARRVLGIDFAPNMIELARAYARRHPAGSKCEFIEADFMQCQITERYDFVAALGVFDYVIEPANLLRRMTDIAANAVIASFPAPSPLRAPLRKLRYSLRNCPVYFYTRSRIEQVCRDAGLTDYRIVPCTSAGYMLIGNVAANSAVRSGSPAAYEAP